MASRAGEFSQIVCARRVGNPGPSCSGVADVPLREGAPQQQQQAQTLLIRQASGIWAHVSGLLLVAVVWAGQEWDGQPAHLLRGLRRIELPGDRPATVVS